MSQGRPPIGYLAVRFDPLAVENFHPALLVSRFILLPAEMETILLEFEFRVTVNNDKSIHGIVIVICYVQAVSFGTHFEFVSPFSSPCSLFSPEIFFYIIFLHPNLFARLLRQTSPLITELQIFRPRFFYSYCSTHVTRGIAFRVHTVERKSPQQRRANYCPVQRTWTVHYPRENDE